MEAQTALVGADRGVELHTVAAVDLDLAVVVHPGNAEDDDALGLDEALHEAGLFPLGVFVDDVLKALKDFVNGLQEVGLVGVVLLKVGEDAVQICIVDHFLTSFLLFALLSKRPDRYFHTAALLWHRNRLHRNEPAARVSAHERDAASPQASLLSSCVHQQKKESGKATISTNICSSVFSNYSNIKSFIDERFDQ